MITKTVYIPACANHDGLFGKTIQLEWICPVCGGPRGDVYDTISFDGSRRLHCHGWQNPCGHIDRYHRVRAEAQSNNLNETEKSS